MAYIPNADDVTLPTLNTLAGTAQADFIAMKQKMNNFFLGSDFVSTLSQQGLQSGTYYLKNLPAGIDTGIMYGHAVNITRNDIAGTGAQVVAAQLTAILGPNLDGLAKNISVFGAATEAWTSNVASHATLIGLESSIIAQYNNNQMALLAGDFVFKNRPDAVDTVVQGLGANHYNTNSRAIQITSQLRSLAGEYCGWNKGITFGIGCFDYQLVGGVPIPAIAIDIASFSSSPATSEPWTAYRISSAVAMSEYMSVTWDALQFTRSYLDSTNHRLVILGTGNSPTTVPLLAFNYVDNILDLPSTAVGGVPGAATGSIRIRTASGDKFIAVT